jgi:hypothetical protein
LSIFYSPGDAIRNDFAVAGSKHSGWRRKISVAEIAIGESRYTIGHGATNQFDRQRRQLIVLALRPAVFTRA